MCFVAPRGCCSHSLCAMCDVAATVTAPHVVSWVPSLRHMWCCSRCRCAMWVSRSPSLCHVWFRGHGHCTACGFVVPNIVPRVVLQSRPLCCVWFCSPGHCAMCGFAVPAIAPHVVLRSWTLCHMGVAVAVFAPHVVSRLWLLFHVWCHGRGHCATCGVVGAIVVPCGFRGCGHCTTWVSLSLSLRHVWFCGCSRCAACGVAVAVVALHVVLRVPSLCRVWFHSRCYHTAPITGQHFTRTTEGTWAHV